MWQLFLHQNAWLDIVSPNLQHGATGFRSTALQVLRSSVAPSPME